MWGEGHSGTWEVSLFPCLRQPEGVTGEKKSQARRWKRPDAGGSEREGRRQQMVSLSEETKRGGTGSEKSQPDPRGPCGGKGGVGS